MQNEFPDRTKRGSHVKLLEGVPELFCYAYYLAPSSGHDTVWHMTVTFQITDNKMVNI